MWNSETKDDSEEKTDLCNINFIQNSLKRKLVHLVVNFTKQGDKKPHNSDIAVLNCTSAQQAETLTPKDPQRLTFAKLRSQEDFVQKSNSELTITATKVFIHLATPENSGNLENSRHEKRI